MCSTSAQERRLARARRHRQVDRVALARRPRRRRRAARVPGLERGLVEAREQHVAATRGRSSLVPLPWCTSQSSTSTRSAPERVERVPGGDRHVGEQAEAHRPRATRRGGRAGAAPRSRPRSPPRAAPRPARTRRPPRAGRPRRSPGRWACPGRTPPPRALVVAHARRRSSAGCTAQQLLGRRPRAPRGARSRASRARSSSASIARMRSGRSGWPRPVSCSSEDGWRK